MKRVFIVHGWGGIPSHGWYPWIEKELKSRGYDAHLLEMPDTENPDIKKWVSFLAKAVKKCDKNTFFVGHSIGCQTIMRYLQKIKEASGGVLFVAGWLNLHNLETDAEKELAAKWIGAPLNFEKIRKAAKKIVAIFSSNDPWVPISDAELFKDKFGAKIIIQKKAGHFTQDDKCYELPIALTELLKLMK